jgi:hypothetical protein
MAGGAKTTAGPSVMGPAGQRVGPLPGGLTQTAAGRPPRSEPRGAVEEELDLTKMLAVKEDVRERMAAAMALVDAVILLAEEAVMESEQKRKPEIALAGRFVRRGGCGCETCTGTVSQEETALGLRKFALPDLLQDALARITRSGWKEDILVSTDAELRLERTLAMWFSQFCCEIIMRCAAGVHPAVYGALEAACTSRISWLQSYWGAVVEEHVQVFGTQIAILAADTLPEELKDVKQQEMQFDWTESEEEEEEREKALTKTEGQGEAEHEKEGWITWLFSHLLYSPLVLLFVLASVAGGLWGLCLAMRDAAIYALSVLGRKTSSVLAVVWQIFLYIGVTLPVAAGVFGLQLLRRAKKEISAAAGDGAQLAQFEEEEEEEKDLVVNRGGVIIAAQGLNRSKAFKASSVSGQRRRAAASARKQSKVFDPGVRR